jgi:IS5 family transposase
MDAYWHAVQEFLGLDLGRDTPPDETTICRFRHLLEEHRLGEKIFQIVNQYLAAAGIRVQNGTIVDATIIQAPTSRKKPAGPPDPEMGATKKGNQMVLRDEGPWRRGQSDEADPLECR